MGNATVFFSSLDWSRTRNPNGETDTPATLTSLFVGRSSWSILLLSLLDEYSRKAAVVVGAPLFIFALLYLYA